MSEPADPWLLHRARAVADDLLRQLSFVRARAYRAVFRPEEGMTREHQAVLADLRDFCFAEASPFSIDPGVTQRNIGRQEVWRRIAGHLALNEDEANRLKALEIDDGR